MFIKRKTIFVFLGIFVSMLFWVGSNGSVKAVNTDTVGILPANPDKNVKFSDAWFIYHLDLGEKKMDGIRVLNNKNDTVVVKLYPVDATTTSDGSFALLPEESERKDAGAWVRLAANEIELAPHSEKIVPFEFAVPSNADVGDHMGGIIMQEIETNADTLSGTGVKIVTRVGVRIYETVPGAVKKDFEVTRFDWRLSPTGAKNWLKDFLDINKKTFFFLGIKNNGNVRITPKVDVRVTNMLGQLVADLRDREVGSIFPRDEVKDSSIPWEGMPLFGRYKVAMTVNFFEEGMAPVTKELVIWAMPYRIIFLLVILGVIFVLFRLIRKYFLEASKEKMPIYTVQAGDTLARLAEKAMVHWKDLVRVNEIKKPYEIRAGQKLFIPLNRKNRELMAKMVANHYLKPSIAEEAGEAQGGKKKIALGIIILFLIGGGAIWGIRMRSSQVVHEEFKVPEKTIEPKIETVERTKSGAFKKSSVRVGVTSAGDADSNGRLIKKLKLIGYEVSLSDRQGGFSATTIEYANGKQAQAEMVKNDLGIKEPVDLVEAPNLAVDVVVHNMASKDEFLNF